MAIVTTRWDEMRWTRRRQALFALDETLIAYGEVVWSWRRDAGAKPCGIFRGAMVTTSPLTKESAL